MASNVKAGDWVQGSEKFLDDTLKKATSGGSAIPRGKFAVLQSTGVWIIAPTSFAGGRTCLVTHPNADSDPTFTGMRDGGTGYGIADGVIKPDQPVTISGSTAGELVELTVPNVSTTPTQADVVAARDLFRKIVGFYGGHADEGDGSADHPKTDAADGDIIKVDIVRSH